MTMHQNQLKITLELVSQLIHQQFPHFSNLPLKPVQSMGTVNAIYRLGKEHYVRLPLMKEYEMSLQKEIMILSTIKKHVSLPIPNPIGIGQPTNDYPLTWAIYEWLPGDTYDSNLVEEDLTAKTLARFVNELQLMPITDTAPKAGRKALLELNEQTILAIHQCSGDIDVEKTLIAWKELVNTTPWNQKPVWIHSDLLKPNLLIHQQQLRAIIDFGSSGIGDPAFDMTPAWDVLTTDKGQQLFKEQVNVTDEVWLRGKAYALHQAALIIPYYRKSNPDFAKQAIQTIGNILDSSL